MEKTTKRKTLQGTVVSNKMDKTVVVQVERRYMHPKFKKVVKSNRKYSAHDENNECKPGDVISIRETRPLSKTKRWRMLEVLEKAVEEGGGS
ncbi:MAG: 30S ribosomal protein S17 [Nitrospinae bacterium]|nr:30S ribosomal protein S17 [Nitrospinota bacterium]MZH14326.1 30S ribosomal protein S17 [Nitrospinota bacterium]